MLLESAEINLKGLFLNADSGSNSQNLRVVCGQHESKADIGINSRWGSRSGFEWTYFDEALYKRRMVIEPRRRTDANAWLDSFKTLLVRNETNVELWLSFD